MEDLGNLSESQNYGYVSAPWPQVSLCMPFSVFVLPNQSVQIKNGLWVRVLENFKKKMETPHFLICKNYFKKFLWKAWGKLSSLL